MLKNDLSQNLSMKIRVLSKFARNVKATVKFYWLILLEKEIRSNKYGQRVVITDCRFPNEIDMIKRLNGIVVRVQRGTTPEWLNDVQAWHAQGRQTPKPVVFDSSDGSKQLPHESEWCSVGLEDAVLENNSTLEDLHANIRKIIKEKYS